MGGQLPIEFLSELERFPLRAEEVRLLDPELVSEFVAQSLEHLEDVEPLLLDMEKRGAASPDAMNEMFRAVHSIKGAAGFLGLEAVQQLSDAMESLFMIAGDSVSAA